MGSFETSSVEQRNARDKERFILAVSEQALASLVCLLSRAFPCLVSFDCILAVHSTEQKVVRLTSSCSFVKPELLCIITT